MSKRTLQIDTGSVRLAEGEAKRDGALVKKALLCHTGTFNGLYGPVTVSRELLEGIAKKYNEAHANPRNDNDLAPILVDHMRSAELVKGRLLASLSVEEWADPKSQDAGFALYGELRVDRDQEKVESGQYCQLSISFDEESLDLFEVSFVAVPAAPGAIALSRGDQTMDTQQMQALAQKHEKLAKRVKELKQVRKATCLSMTENLSAGETDMTVLVADLQKAVLGLRTAALSGQFKGLIRQGKLSKAEFNALGLAELAAMPAKALSAIVKAYESRPVSSDVIQHGQVGAKPIELSAQSPAKIRELIELQRSGKGVALADDKKPGEEDEAKLKEKDPTPGGEAAQEKKPDGDEDSKGELSLDDLEGSIKDVDSLAPMVEKISASMKRMSETLKKLMEQDEDEKEQGDE